MDIQQIPLFAVLKSKLNYATQRQRVIAQNVANADTPGFAPRDLKKFNFDAALSSAGGGQGVPAVRLQPGHMDLGASTGAGLGSSGGGEETGGPDSEVQLSGNRVVLEEQMLKMQEAQSDFGAAIGLYQSSLNLLRTAIHKPGT